MNNAARRAHTELINRVEDVNVREILRGMLEEMVELQREIDELEKKLDDINPPYQRVDAVSRYRNSL